MNIFNFSKVVFFAFITMLTCACGQSNDELKIRQLEKDWTQLLNKGDTTSLLKIWSKDYVVNNPNGKIVTPKEIIDLMKSGHKFPAVERIIEKVTFNRDIAIVMGKELEQPSNLTMDQNEWIPRRFTNVWIKSKNGWQLAARQSSKIPKE